ncbi:hypothetical protein TgHK011_007531 [Trichoderma gracile]|nr:hypothetical protein TgHK011_007531 [Trichoderma gracile]
MARLGTSIHPSEIGPAEQQSQSPVNPCNKRGAAAGEEATDEEYPYFEKCRVWRRLEDLNLFTFESNHANTQPQSLQSNKRRNHVIAIIIIVLFVVLAAISFGIYKLVHGARRELTVTSASSSSNSHSLAD